MKSSPVGHIRGVTHPGYGERQPYSGSEFDADVCVA